MSAAVETVEREPRIPASAPPSRQGVERAVCFHCGERCPDLNFTRGDKAFCCNGCMVVHDLLAESGLENFYCLTEHPGVRMRQSRREQWAHLDDPALQQRLLDFANGNICRVTFHVPAIHCIACVWLLENLFRLHPGVTSSRVNFPRREVAIQFNCECAQAPAGAGATIKLSELVALLVSIGYEPSLTLNELEKRASDPARKRRWIQIGVAGFAFGNIMLFSLPHYFGLEDSGGVLLRRTFTYLSLLLATPVVFYSASDYWKSALLSLRQRVLTLDVPIALGLGAIYGTSVFQVFTGTGPGYCDSLTGLIFFLLCGRAFQQKTHERIAFDRDYKSFFPLSVTRLEPVGADGASGFGPRAEARVSVSELRRGDHVLLRNGELIPADARLLNGPAMIDYSFVTGESEPVAKSGGDYLYAGGKQTGGAIEIEIVKPVSQSYLMSLWNDEAFQKNSDGNLNSLTNRYSRHFTLIVIAIALGAAVFWTAGGSFPRGLKAFASVLIVACPCALALAAPFTLGTAQRLLARLNIFVKNALVLERLGRVDTIVFDKTGTLTAANTSRANVQMADGRELSEEEIAMVCSVAKQSTHPYSQRIYQSFAAERVTKSPDAFAETPGMGIEAEVAGHEVLLGSQLWIESHEIKFAPTSAAANGVCLAIDGEFRGVFTIQNSLRAETDRLFQKLSGRYEVALLSGDNERERELFWNFFTDDGAMRFNQTPLDKLDFIRQLQRAGKTVMMVGDGLNDAGALKQSDVGVAVVENVGAFSPASDVILQAGRVADLDRVLKLAGQSRRIVILSLAISAIYNVLGVSIAAAGILSPIVCAVLMPVSSLSVVLFAIGTTTLATRRSGLLSTETRDGRAPQ